MRQLYSVYVEAVLLSACDVIVHSLSGFSMFAAQWGMIPVDNVRVLPRRYDWLPCGDGSGGRFCPWWSCTAQSYYPHYYQPFFPNVDND